MIHMFMGVSRGKDGWEVNFENDRFIILKIDRGSFRVE